MNKNWYAVYTRSNCEKKVTALLQRKKIEHYSPVNRVAKNGLERRKLVYEPLFPSHVFVKATVDEMQVIRQTTDVINFVYWLGNPVVIKEMEIENMKRFLDEHTNVQLEKTSVNNSEKVRIISGPLMDMAGNVISKENNNVKLSLPSLGYMLVAEVKKSSVELINYSYKVGNMIS